MPGCSEHRAASVVDAGRHTRSGCAATGPTDARHSMYAPIRGTRLYFDIEGAGLVPDAPAMREKPVAFIIHGGPGSDHSGFKPVMNPLAEKAQLVFFDHRGQGRSGRADPDGDPARFT